MQNLKFKPYKNVVYLDNAATTRIDKAVLASMEPYTDKAYGNPGGMYSLGYQARETIDKARKTVAKHLNCTPFEIIFTGSGTEANNMVLAGVARANKSNGNHIITTKVEHPSVIEVCETLEREGFRITYLNVDKYGVVKLDELEKELTPETILVSVMYANNEIGTIEPIEEISKIIKKHKNSSGLPYFHTDACQAAGALDLDVEKLGVDFMTLNGGKIYGPKGIGALYIRKGTKIKPQILGGGHERGIRSGTENIPGIAGLAKAAELGQKNLSEKILKVTKMRDYLINSLLDKIDEVKFNGHPTQRLPGNCNFSFKYIEGESIVLKLDLAGIAASSGSACSSSSLKPSHTLVAMGLSNEEAYGSLRITLGFENTKEEIDYFLKVIPEIISDLRKISPLYKK